MCHTLRYALLRYRITGYPINIFSLLYRFIGIGFKLVRIDHFILCFKFFSGLNFGLHFFKFKTLLFISEVTG